jgi:alanyl-tRNA synthetase
VLGITRPFLSELLKPLAEAHGSLLTGEEHALVPSLVRMLAHEEALFERVLTVGLRYLSQVEPDEHGIVSGEHLFKLHAERGFPADLAAEVLAERGLQVDWPGYERALEEHRSVSRASVEKHFQGM